LYPRKIPFISYPYEWSFQQLKDAALATLSIQKRALKYGMSLKDASAYNIQFLDGKAVLIDTLSFEIYKEGEPWVAYRQFCQHFLAPLALMSVRDIRLGQLLRIYIDGIPLDLASHLLPPRSRWNWGMLSHIHMHAQAQKRYSNSSLDQERHGRVINMPAFLAILDNIKKTIQGLKWKPSGTEWGDYYDKTNYTSKAFSWKKSLVNAWAQQVHPTLTWDLGANTGVFSREVSTTDSYVVAWDIDPAAVEQNWQRIRSEKEPNLLPLVLDLTNPSPGLGWNHQERDSFSQRGPVDLVMALGLVHHLAISNNLPLDQIASAMAGWGKWLIVEFIPKSDLQVQKLLRSRKDIFTSYSQAGFEAVFKQYFKIHQAQPLPESERWMYLMEAL
jgi:ribosomal protein L11 methylase PrmA